MITPHARSRVAAGLALVAWLPACGGSPVTPPPPPTPTPAPVTSVIFQSAFPPLDRFDAAIGDFAIPDSGAVRVTMDWTFPSNDMDIIIFSGTTCADFEAFLSNGSAPGCTVLGQDLDPVRKPAVVTFNVAQAQNARILLYNLGPTSESGVVQITLTH
jgi:hypothetical protein